LTFAQASAPNLERAVNYWDGNVPEVKDFIGATAMKNFLAVTAYAISSLRLRYLTARSEDSSEFSRFCPWPEKFMGKMKITLSYL